MANRWSAGLLQFLLTKMKLNQPISRTSSVIPNIQAANEQSRSTPCSLHGGFDFKEGTTNTATLRSTCRDDWLPQRVESNCLEGEGLNFYFSQSACSLFTRPQIRTLVKCYASWTEGGSKFFLITDQPHRRHYQDPPHYVLRLPSNYDDLKTFKAELFINGFAPYKKLLLLPPPPHHHQHLHNQSHSLKNEAFNQPTSTSSSSNNNNNNSNNNNVELSAPSKDMELASSADGSYKGEDGNESYHNVNRYNNDDDDDAAAADDDVISLAGPYFLLHATRSDSSVCYDVSLDACPTFLLDGNCSKDVNIAKKHCPKSCTSCGMGSEWDLSFDSYKMSNGKQMMGDEDGEEDDLSDDDEEEDDDDNMLTYALRQPIHLIPVDDVTRGACNLNMRAEMEVTSSAGYVCVGQVSDLDVMTCRQSSRMTLHIDEGCGGQERVEEHHCLHSFETSSNQQLLVTARTMNNNNNNINNINNNINNNNINNNNNGVDDEANVNVNVVDVLKGRKSCWVNLIGYKRFEDEGLNIHIIKNNNINNNNISNNIISVDMQLVNCRTLRAVHTTKHRNDVIHMKLFNG
ncbi:hypothetical protein HELRODRAFT_179666 [Helobdella robusta]|uniref:ShKT domain-containing protein n=1 Tax=Helobdella robusta TaxID=6412 RepID=T1FF03_HELRO|nr:hypothetical protein HELRODRAFT_179666 [Helobdella robusta]ESN95082.1 hypothetical protein HELRODRAFT_179666 [Helobdella robusta]